MDKLKQPLVVAAIALLGGWMFFRDSTPTPRPAVSRIATPVTCAPSFDRIAAQKRLMKDPSLIASRPDATDPRVTPVEWMMLSEWQRSVITAQNLNMPGNVAGNGSCASEVAAVADGLTDFVSTP